jgi:hypothetical protein
MASDLYASWNTMAQAVRGCDEVRVKDIKEDIDTLLVFVRDTFLVLAVSNVMH